MMWAEMTTAERVEAVTAGVAGGMSATQIARERGTTKAAVIGLAGRHKIRLNGSPMARPAAKPAPRVKPPLLGTWGAVPRPAFIPPSMLRLLPARAPAPPPIGGVHLNDLAGSQCRRPLWPDDAHSNLRFCGAETAGPRHTYCPACEPLMFRSDLSPSQRDKYLDRVAAQARANWARKAA
jgi:hypothetical protein